MRPRARGPRRRIPRQGDVPFAPLLIVCFQQSAAHAAGGTTMNRIDPGLPRSNLAGHYRKLLKAGEPGAGLEAIAEAEGLEGAGGGDPDLSDGGIRDRLDLARDE